MKLKCIYLFSLFHFLIFSLKAQELFPHAEPASNIPKGVLGIRIVNEGYNEATQLRSEQSFKFMFGLSPKFMFTQSFNFSNHHGKKFPTDFIQNDSTVGSYTNGVKKGGKYPYVFENFNLNIKYRFFSRDGEKSHFRMSANLELAGGNEAHHEAEPSLMGDNGGIGAGVTATKLQKRFAISVNIGGIIPQHYYYQHIDSTLEVKYGKALTYSLSMGMLCLPFKYKNYRQTNVNIYAEFVGEMYEGAKVYDKEKQVDISNVPGLDKGAYLEFRPSIQFIFHSNLRVDLSVGTPVINHSYAHTSTVFYFNIQRYFYFKN